MRFYYLARNVVEVSKDAGMIRGRLGNDRLTRGDAQVVLTELLNSGNADAIKRFTKLYGPIVPFKPGDSFTFSERDFQAIRDLFRHFWEAPKDGVAVVPLPAFHPYFPGQLAAMWFRLRGIWATDSLLNWLVISAFSLPQKLFRTCEQKECAAYFIASKSQRKFCSDACAADIKKAAGAEWWRQHGEQWRANRKSKSSGRKHKSRKKGKS